MFSVPFPPAILGRPVSCRIRRAHKVDIGRPVVPREVRTVAICAGSGGSVLDGVDADVYLTGEMSHVRFFGFLCRPCFVHVAHRARCCFCHVMFTLLSPVLIYLRRSMKSWQQSQQEDTSSFVSAL